MVLPSPVGESVAANFISKPFLPRFPQRVRRAFVLYTSPRSTHTRLHSNELNIP
jgi:hypothetical protein